MTSKPIQYFLRTSAAALCILLSACGGGESAPVSASAGASTPLTPSISGLSPASGDAGVLVTISGTNLGWFTTTPLVKFGTTSATNTSANATTIVVSVPAGLAAGIVPVTVANADGSGAVSAGNFTVTVAAPPNANALSSGTGYAIVYSGSANTPPAGPNPGIDHRTSVNAQFDTSGKLTGYTFSVDEAPTIGSASVAELATDTIMSVGRWTSGTLGGAFYGGTLVFDVSHGFHYAVAKPTLTSALPSTGTLAYQLSAATKPSYLDARAAPGTLTGSAAVNFASKTVGLNLTLTFSDATYTLTTNGGVTTPANSVVSYADPTNFNGGKAIGTGFGAMLTGGSCSPTCDVNVRIMFGGQAGERLGVAIQGGTLPLLMHGAAMFSNP